MDSGDSRIKKFAAGLGIFQGLAWSIMALICIILYLSSTITTVPTTYMGTVGYTIYAFHLAYSDKVFPGQNFTGGVFTGFMWIYFILDIVWIAASIDLLRRDTAKVLRSWSIITLGLAFWDFITFVILGADYSKCLDAAQPDMGLEGLCANAILPVFVIAAKGFTLWIFNICVGITIFRMSRQQK